MADILVRALSLTFTVAATPVFIKELKEVIMLLKGEE